MMPFISFCLIAMIGAPSCSAMPVRVVDTWAVEVGSGEVTLDGRAITLKEAVRIEVSPPAVTKVSDEPYEALPVFNDAVPGWVKGVCVRPLKTQECSATGLLKPGSLRLKRSPGSADYYQKDKDYKVDEFWATFGRMEGGAIPAGQPVYVDYEYALNRLDAIVADRDGNVRIHAGAPAPALALPPALADGDTLLANIFVEGDKTELAADNVFHRDAGVTAPYADLTPVAEKLLPKTLAKLRAGETVTIVAFGDSVTCGGGVEKEDDWYQHQFQRLLQARFPKATVKMLTAGWGGASSQMFLDAPAGSEHDFNRNLIEPKPDLVTIEFVNDAYLDEAGVEKHYSGIVSTLRANGSEVVLITPHLVRPDWMKADSLKFDEDPRAYVRGLKTFGAVHDVAVADASAEWCTLWRRGIPYTTLLANSINHPDVRGQEIFARVLLGLFHEE